MAKKNEASQNQSAVEDIELALTKTEQYIEDNQRQLGIIIGAIVIVILAFLGAKKYVFEPKEQEARNQLFIAEKYFEQDSFNLALEGDGMNLGFLDVANDYGMTKSAKLANYYAGLCYLNLGEYEDAIDYLKKFKSKDKIVKTLSYAAIGDAYVELNENSEALSYYEKAINHSNNDFTSPKFMFKAAKVYEAEQNYDKALKLYSDVKSSYPNSTEGRIAEKYMARVEILMNN